MGTILRHRNICRYVLAALVLSGAAAPSSAETVSLDSCRTMALQSNKRMLIGNESVKQAHYQNREAFAAYLPVFIFVIVVFLLLGAIAWLCIM